MAKGKRKERVRRPYVFDMDKARKLRDENYKGKDNATATLLRGLITADKEGYTIPEMVKISGFKGKVSEFGIPPVLFAEGVLERTRERKAKPRRAAKPKRAAKPRAPKTVAAVATEQAATASA